MMNRLQRYWKQIPTAIRKPLVFMVGTAVIVAGLVMLIFPGPGWAAIFLGFAILATEFAAAEKVRAWMVKEFKRLLELFKQWWNRYKKRFSKHKH